MVTVCWAAKGGSGTTVVATALALYATRPTLLADLDGEIPALLGLPDPERPGAADWVLSDAPQSHLGDLLIEIGERRWLLPWHGGGSTNGLSTASMYEFAERQRWQQLADWLQNWGEAAGGTVIVDAGTGEPHPALLEVAERALLVIRPCYLALRRAVRSPIRPTGVVFVDEVGHGLTRRDVEQALGVPVEASVSIDPAIARAVDAGLLASRMPRLIQRELRRVAA